MVDIARNGVLVLAILVAVGGVIGFLKARSKASLIAGLLSGALLAITYCIALSAPTSGLAAADCVAILVGAIFAFRLRKTGKFMPSGLLLVLCALNVAMVTFTLVQLR